MATSKIKVNSIMGGANITSEIKSIACKMSVSRSDNNNVFAVSISDLTNGLITNTANIVGVSAFAGNVVGSNGAIIAGARVSTGTPDNLIVYLSSTTALPASYTLDLRVVIFYT